MDSVDHVQLARQLIDIESTTGNEGEVATWLAAFLRERGCVPAQDRLSQEAEAALVDITLDEPTADSGRDLDDHTIELHEVK
ncbi:MAG: hypothetical protein ACRD1W_10580, partial [Vicinamibacterales bacterium]